MPDWIAYVWALIQAQPIITIVVGIVIVFVANKAGYVLPEAWREIIYNLCVKALGKLLGFEPAPAEPVPVESRITAQDKLEAFVVLDEGCKDCPAASEPLKQLWAHLQPGSHRDRPVDSAKDWSIKEKGKC